MPRMSEEMKELVRNNLPGIDVNRTFATTYEIKQICDAAKESLRQKNVEHCSQLGMTPGAIVEHLGKKYTIKSIDRSGYVWLEGKRGAFNPKSLKLIS